MYRRNNMKPILYIDMDNVLVDFKTGMEKLDQQTLKEYQDRYDEVKGIFSLMKPIEGAIEAVKELSKKYDIYVLSTAPWNNSSAWSDKNEWIKKHFGSDENSVLYKKLILTHHKNLNDGQFIIDDRTKNGVDLFKGEHIHFGNDKFPDWNTVVNYLMSK